MDGAIDIAAQKKFLLFLRRIILKKQILDFILRNPSKLYRLILMWSNFFSKCRITITKVAQNLLT